MSEQIETKSNMSQGDGTSRDEKNNSDLPSIFSLLAPINVPYDVTGQAILDMSAKRIKESADYTPVFDEDCCAPKPPIPQEVDGNLLHDQSQLLRHVPLLNVESRDDAQSLELKLHDVPIALIRNLPSVLNMDLSLFTTEEIVKNAGSTKIEIRTQNLMPSDVNVDPLGHSTWMCESTQSFTSISKYAQYQAETFQHSLEEEAEKLRQVEAKSAQQITDGHGGKRKKFLEKYEKRVSIKKIKFGTNLDLSDSTKWKCQIEEISKMPQFCRINDSGNMLSHLDHQILGMNTVQLYMKVPGTRTPAHQENNSICSININVGPGNCEWFGCPYEYWGVVEALCRKNGVDFLTGSYWPNIKELLEANVPVYRFTQKAGDMVWVGSGCVHWVQAIGICNNFSWNVAPMNCSQLSVAIKSYEWNKLSNYKSLVPIQYLAWQLAKNVHFESQAIYELVRGILIRSLSFSKIVTDFAVSKNKELRQQAREKGEVAHYCCECSVEVFNILFVKKQKRKYTVHCVYCAKKDGLENVTVLQQYPMSELTEIFDGIVLNPPLENSLAQ